MRLFSNTILFIISAALIFSCAKSTDSDWNETEQLSFDTWMKLNNPQAEKLDNGMYIEWLRPKQNGPRLETGQWIMLNYRGTTLQNNVFMTRYEEEAKLEGTFSNYCRYTPHYMQYTSNMGLTEGEMTALEMMSLDDSVRVYLPSRLAYGDTGASFSSAYGYQGNSYAVGENTPVIIDLVIKEIIESAEAEEIRQVRSVASEWNLDSDRDTLTVNFYKRLLEQDSNEIVPEDSVVYIDYVGRFLDGFLYQTNVDSIAKKEWMDYTTTYAAKKYTVQQTSSSTATSDVPASAFYTVFTKPESEITYDSYFEMVFISDYAYGSIGRSATSTSPVIYPYTPLVYQVRTYKKDYDPSK